MSENIEEQNKIETKEEIGTNSIKEETIETNDKPENIVEMKVEDNIVIKDEHNEEDEDEEEEEEEDDDNEKENKDEEVNEQTKNNNKKNVIKEDKILEKEEDKNDDNQIELIARKKILNPIDSCLKAEEENVEKDKDESKKENDKEKDKEEDVNSQKERKEDKEEEKKEDKKEITEIKQMEETKEINENKNIINTRKRYTFPSNNIFLNNPENPKNNKINEKKNHQIYISIVPITTKNVKITQIENNQPKNISKTINTTKTYNPPSKTNKSLINNNINNNSKQKNINENESNIYQRRKLEISKPIVVNNNNINKINEKNINQKYVCKTESNISQPKNKNIIQNKPQTHIQTQRQNNKIETKNIQSIPLSQSQKPNEIKIINKYTKPLNENKKQDKKDINKKIMINTTKYYRNKKNNDEEKIKTNINDSRYSNKKVEPPTPDLKSKATKKIYPHIKIDMSKYNTEKKPNDKMKRLYENNSKTLDNRKKEEVPKLKYYEICPNCGYHLN